MSHREISWDHFTRKLPGHQEKTFEYEVKWQFKSMDSNTWVEKDHGRPWQTMADGNQTGADVWHPKHETVMVIKKTAENGRFD